MRDTIKFFFFLGISTTVLAESGDFIDSDSFEVSAAAFADRTQTGDIFWTATEGSAPGTYNIEASYGQTAQIGNADGDWSFGIRKKTGGSPSQFVSVASPNDTVAIFGIPNDQFVEVGLVWNPSPPQEFMVPVLPAADVCEDIDISEVITNNSSSPRRYYWEMNEGVGGWQPAETPEHGLWADIILGPGETMTINMELTAEQNPECAEFVLRSCSAFNGESPDPNCGQIELTVDPNSDELTPPSSSGPTSFGPGTFDNDMATNAFDDPSISPDESDLATATGQEDQIKAAQALAQWQAIQNYNNTQTIVSSLSSITGGDVDIDLEGVEDRIDISNTELASIEVNTLNIADELTQTFDAATNAPTDDSEGDTINLDVASILTKSTSIVNDTLAALPPSPIIPSSLGTKSFISMDFNWKDMPPIIIDFAPFSTSINWFRQLLLWLIYLLTWFVAIKIIRSAFAG